MAVRDPIREGLAAGWKVTDAVTLENVLDLETDVVVIGSGAGGGVSAEALAAAGLDVVIVEEGPLASSTDFRMREREAYPQLYQESSARQTGQVDHHPPGALRGRRHDRELDLELPHARPHACLLEGGGD